MSAVPPSQPTNGAKRPRYRCTAAMPYRPEYDSAPWYHPEAKCISEEYYGLLAGGSYEQLECPHCGHRFRVMVPD